MVPLLVHFKMMRCLLLLCITAFIADCSAFRAPCGLCRVTQNARSGPSHPGHSLTTVRSALGTNENRYYVPPKYLINALKGKPDQRVTVGDISSLSGAELTLAQRDLMELAHASGAALQVTTQGDIVYAFPEDLEQVLLRRSYARRVQRLYQKVAPTLMFLFRASFGLCLVASLAVILVALTAATTAASTSNKQSEKEKEKEKKRGRHRVHYDRPRVVAVLDLADIVRTALRLARWHRMPYSQGSSSSSSHEMGFLDSFYSFVFGDGDPNAGFELQAAAKTAQLIRDNGGVVIAEQLSPFLPNPPPLSRPVGDESFVLPLLLRFAGQPSVTIAGNIAYTFQELMVTGKNGLPDTMTPVHPQSVLLLEKETPFSSASPFQKFLATCLAGLNLVGALALGRVVQGSSPWVKAVYPLLMSYSIMFTAVPAVRLVAGRVQNARIRERNARRLDWMRHTSGDKALQEKWRDAHRSAPEMARATGNSDIVYDSTQRDDDMFS